MEIQKYSSFSFFIGRPPPSLFSHRTLMHVCTVLYCVRYVYAPVHIRLRHVIGGGNFWKFHKSAGNSIKSAGNLTRNLYE